MAGKNKMFPSNTTENWVLQCTIVVFVWFIADCKQHTGKGKTDPGHFSLVIKVFSNSDACRTEYVNTEEPDCNSLQKYLGLIIYRATLLLEVSL